MVALMTLELFHFNETDFQTQLQTLVDQVPRFFKNTPAVLALECLSAASSIPDFNYIRALCAGFSINIFAVRGGHQTLQNAAANAGLACLPAQRFTATNRDNCLIKDAEFDSALSMMQVEHSLKRQVNASCAITSEDTSDNHQLNKQPTESDPSTRIITQPVRSGQQIYHAGELIILASVGAGAEILADGNIHVYGPLRGRALAGVNGNNDAHIFCQHFEAELISINGRFKPAGAIDEIYWKAAVHTWLDDETLLFAKL